MTTRVVALTFGLLLSLAATARGQEVELDKVLDRLAASWARGDANALAAYSAIAGLSLDIDGEPTGPLSPRQAAAVLKNLFGGRATDSLTTGISRVIGGQPLRAFGELTWTVRMQGTTIPIRNTVFLALVWEGDAWRLTQIRLLR